MGDIRDFGAKGDGIQLDSPAIQAACNAAARSGGGTVVIPPGRWRCGTIHLKSRIKLDLQLGATLIASSDLADYPAHGGLSRASNRDPYHLLIIDDCCDVEISGGGSIDGSGASFWHTADAEQGWLKPHQQRITPLIEVVDSERIRFQNITITMAAGWAIHCRCSQHLWLSDLSISNHPFAPDGDGVIINGCHEVSIRGCHITTSCDAIAIRSSDDTQSCSSISVADCHLQCHGTALKIGSQTWHNISHISMHHCVIRRSSRAIGIYAYDGAMIEHISIAGIVCDTEVPFVLNRPIHIDLRQRHPTSRRSRLRFVNITQFSATSDGRILLTCGDDCEASEIHLSDITLNLPVLCDPSLAGLDARSGECSTHHDDARCAAAALVADGLDQLHVQDFTVVWPPIGNDGTWCDNAPRFEHGSDRRFAPATDEKTIPYAVFWGRGLIGGRIDLGGLSASQPGHPVADIAESSRTVIILDDEDNDESQSIDGESIEIER